MGIIRDLLNEEPDSKWCLESLVHYTLLLSRDSASDAKDLSHASDASKEKSEVESMLRKLVQIDPMRRARYSTIARELRIDVSSSPP